MSSALTYISGRSGIPNTISSSEWPHSQNPLLQPRPDFLSDTRFLLPPKIFFSLSLSEPELDSEPESDAEYGSSPEP